MRFPSFQSVINSFLRVIKRFPLESLVAVVASVSLMILIEREKFPDEQLDRNIMKLVLCCWLGLNLFLSATLYGERKKFSGLRLLILPGFILLLLTGYYFVLDFDVESQMIQYAFLIVGAHLLVSFASFINTGTVEAFWEFNKILFLRILTAGLYSTVLYTGITIALVSTDALFELSFDEDLYAKLAFFIYGVFNTLFFLDGVPLLRDDETDASYPKGLRVFTQYVLIPLAIIYLGILLSYEAKLIIQWALPKGLVGSLVLGYAVFGILAILLVYPIRNLEAYVWIKTFSRWFYLLLIPLIVLLAIAISIRVNAYGITESRYVVIMLALWLSGITAYFIFSKKENIKIIPISLCVVAFLSAVGPQSATSISKLSQVGRLIEIFESQGAIRNGKLVSLKEGSDEARSIAYFLGSRYSSKVFKPLVDLNLDSIYQQSSTVYKDYEVRQAVFEYLGLDLATAPEFDYYSVTLKTSRVEIHGYDQLINFQKNNSGEDTQVTFDGTSIRIMSDSLTASFDLKPILDNAVDNSKSSDNNYMTLPTDKLSLESEDKSQRLIIHYIYFSRAGASDYTINSCDGYLLFKSPSVLRE